MLFWAGIIRHSRSANQIVRCFKGKKHEKIRGLSRFFAFIEARRNIMLLWVMTPKYSWPIILQHFLLLNCLTHIT